jgi:hypothetical protein
MASVHCQFSSSNSKGLTKRPRSILPRGGVTHAYAFTKMWQYFLTGAKLYHRLTLAIRQNIDCIAGTLCHRLLCYCHFDRGFTAALRVFEQCHFHYAYN